MLASFGEGSNSLKSAEKGAGLGLPIAKNLIDLHGGTFTLKSKLRIGTEVIVTFPPERVMSALPPTAENAPPIQPQADMSSSFSPMSSSSGSSPSSSYQQSMSRARRALFGIGSFDGIDCLVFAGVRSMVPRDSFENIMPVAEASLATSCNRVCVMPPARQICIGCGRTLDEVARWLEFSDLERGRIMAQLPARLATSNPAMAAQG